MKRMVRLLGMLALLGASGAAGAHTGHGASGFLAGLAHPLNGMDHLLAMLAVGLWAGQAGGRRIWLLPALFMATLAIGALAGTLQPSLPLVEQGIAASVLVLGLLIASPTRLALPASMALVAVFGLFHGHAHGSEMPDASAPLGYALGFLAATAALHLGGIATSRTMCERFTRLVQALGMGIASCGAWMLAAIQI